MAQDLVDIAGVVFSLFGTSAMVFIIVWWDERRLSPERLERAWPASTRLASAVAFGPFCLPVHFWRTRRSVVGILTGILYSAGVLAINFGFLALLDYILSQFS
ncbi:hypothetical protein [Pendulispora albinea]|uniref:Uncharacterized protein n=1 Tax=Pendulispora albinea TaxID=2741071 RepID=A0ABZ2M9T7_9BACT